MPFNTNNLQIFIESNQLWIGIVVGWLLTRFMETLRKPDLKFDPVDDSDFIRGNKKFKFINVSITNNEQSSIRKLFFGNSSLNSGRAWIIFQDYSSKIEVLRVNARWASTKEPIDYSSGQPLIPEIVLPSRDTIPPGETAVVSVAIKESSEDSFFAFNNESYLHNWKNADFELKDNKYWLKVLLLADGEEYSKEFLLLNPSKSLRNFRIIKN